MPQTQSPRWPGATRGAVTSDDGTTIGYDIVGDGPGVVIAPGALHAGHHYRKLAELLASDHTVYTVDRRGRPGSGPQRDDHGIDAECADMIAVLRATGASAMFGHSSGGVVALQTALRHPVKHLALYEPAMSDGGSVPVDFRPRMERALARGRKAEAMAILAKNLGLAGPIAERFVPTFVMAAMVSAGVRRAGPDVQEMLDAVDTFPAEHRMVEALDAHPDRYREIEAQTLVLLGEKTRGYLERGARSLAETVPGARLTVLAKLDHGGPDEHPQAVAPELLRFFAAA